MILYGWSISPFVRKVLACAAEKGIPLELEATDFPHLSPELLEASPFRKVPALRDGDFTLPDSSAIIHYLEARYPEPPLIPVDPQQRGKTIWYEEFADTIVCAAAAKIFFNRIVAPLIGRSGDLEAAAACERDDLPRVLDYLEKMVPGGDGFLLGDSLTLADVAVASPFANFKHTHTRIDPERYPRTLAYTSRMLSRPSFAHWVAREEAYLSTKVVV